MTADNPAGRTDARPPRVALVHDWLTGMRGGEKVLEAISAIYPQAPVFTLVRLRGSVSPVLEARRIRTSPAQWLPKAGRSQRRWSSRNSAQHS